MPAPMALRDSYQTWLSAFNPWWVDHDAISTDREIVAWEASRIRYVPELLGEMRQDIDADTSVVYTIRGSRQVGKTTLAKLLLRSLFEEGISPWRTCYCSVGSGFGVQDLVRIVNDYLELSSSYRNTQRFYIIVDEISLIPQWQYAVLELSNMHALENCAFIATGSNAVDLTRATESLIGRKGMVPRGNHRSLYPMSFLEYARLTNEHVHKFLETNGLYDRGTRATMWNNIVENKENSLLRTFSAMSNHLNSVLLKYATTGGIPRIVNAVLDHGTIADPLYRDYLGGIMYEWGGLKYPIYRLTNYAEFILHHIGDTVTWNGIANKLDLPNTTAAETYAYTLRDMYITLVTLTYDKLHDKGSIRKAKKIHIRDPFYIHALNAIGGDKNHFARAMDYVSNSANMGRLVECVIADHLARSPLSAPHAESAIEAPERMFHWRDDAGREVDFVYRRDDAPPVPIEVKYADRVDRRKLGGMASFIDATEATRGIVASRSEYSVHSDYTIVPAGVLLALLS